MTEELTQISEMKLFWRLTRIISGWRTARTYYERAEVALIDRRAAIKIIDNNGGIEK